MCQTGTGFRIRRDSNDGVMICGDVFIRYDTMCNIDNYVMILHGQRRGYNGVYNSQKWKLTPSGKKRLRVM